MNIKMGNQYPDMLPDTDIDIERQVKLFAEGGQSAGDFSYDFALPATAKNRGIFSLYSINQNGKIIYSNIPAEIQNEGGITVYTGYIVVESDNEREIICSFYSGNTNWLSLLDFPIRDFDFSSFDLDWDLTNISNTEASTTGVMFPVINTGVMETRSYVNWHRDDFHPFVYCKSIIQYLLNRNGIKIEGDLLQDFRYQNLITSSGKAAAPQEEIDDRTVRVNKSTTQTLIAAAVTVITFPNTTGDYFPGDLWNTGTNTFTADSDMLVDITITLEASLAASNTFGATLFINGVEQLINNGSYILIFGSGAAETKTRTVTGIKLVSGDTVNFRGVSITANTDVLSGTFTITPTRIYRVFTQYLLPDQSAKEFLTDVFSLFNPVINYNATTKTVTANLFKNVIRKPELDISRYVNPGTISPDYTSLMKNYGRENYFSYSASSTEMAERYNEQNAIPFGAGVIDSENQNAQGQADGLESNFVAVFENQKNPFGTYLPILNWRQLGNGGQSDDGVSITNAGGFIITASGYNIGDLVSIENSTNPIYNGIWIVSATPSSNTFRLGGVVYAGDATADIEKLVIEFVDSDEQALLLAIPNLGLTSFTNNSLMFYADASGLTGVSSPATAYFHKPLQGLNIDGYKDSLSFGPVTIPKAHQITMLDSYWRDFERIIRDPVILKAEANFPKTIFDALFDGPLRIKTDRFNAQFFMSGVTGYRDKHRPCEIEAIKL